MNKYYSAIGSAEIGGIGNRRVCSSLIFTRCVALMTSARTPHRPGSITTANIAESTAASKHLSGASRTLGPLGLTLPLTLSPSSYPLTALELTVMK